MQKEIILGILSLFLAESANAQIAVKNVASNDSDIVLTGLNPSTSYKFIYNNKPATKKIDTNACGYGGASNSIGNVTFNSESFANAPLISDSIKCINGAITYDPDTPQGQKLSSHTTRKLFKIPGTTGARIFIGNAPPFSSQVVTSTTEKDDKSSKSNSCGIVTLKRSADWDNNTTIMVEEKVGEDYQPVGTINFASLPVSDAICSKNTMYFRQGFPASSNL